MRQAEFIPAFLFHLAVVFLTSAHSRPENKTRNKVTQFTKKQRQIQRSGFAKMRHFFGFQISLIDPVGDFAFFAGKRREKTRFKKC